MNIDIELEIDDKDLDIGDKIGNGSFGTVFHATWRATPVAVKLCRSDSIEIEFFNKELAALSKLHHPNILQLLGASVKQSPYKIILELMETDIVHMNGHNTSITRACEIAKDITRGLIYLHNRKPKAVIHRDLKPSNILLSKSGKVKIADFGLSCFRNVSNERYKMTGNTGSYRYMAPEIMMNNEYNCTVDIYSFGLIFYGLLEDLPYMDASNDQIKKNVIINKKPIFCSRTPRVLRDIIENCWSYNPQFRPSAFELIHLLDSYKETIKFKSFCFAM